LLTMSAEMLDNYLMFHHYDQQEVLDCIPLYRSDEFIKLIKRYPDYAATITALYKERRHASCFEKIGWIVQNKHYKGFTKRITQLYYDLQKEQQNQRKQQAGRAAEQKAQEAPTRHLTEALDASDSYFDFACSANNIADAVIKKATAKEPLHSERELFIDMAMDELYEPHSEQHFVFNCALVEHTLSDVHDAAKNNDNCQQARLFKQALTTFVTQLNPVTQVTQWVDLIVGTARFVADVTVGKLYLTPLQYQARIASYYDTFSAFSWSNLSQINKEQWIDLGAKIAADCVFMSGVTKIALYLKELQTIASVQHKASAVAQVLRTSVTTKMNKHAMSVASDGTIVKYGIEPPKALGSAVPGIVGDTKSMLFALQEQLMTEVKAAVPLLRKEYACIRRGFRESAHKYIKFDYEHIFGIELDFGRRGKPRIKGFHYDNLNKIQHRGLIDFSEIAVDQNGFYSARLFFEGYPIKHEATFFPAHWSKRQVIESIIEAYDDFISNGAKPLGFRNNHYTIQGACLNNVTLEIIISTSGRIKTVYPILRK